MDKILLRDRNLQIIFVITLFAVMGVASIAPVLPQIIDYFNISDKQVGLLFTWFTLPGIILPPLFGILADRIGRKPVLIPSLFLFGISGFICVFTRDFKHLLWLRFFQGIGAASLGSLNITLIGDLYSGRSRADAMGYNAGVLSIGTALYPALGGALALAGWYMPFSLPLLTVPLGIYVALKLKVPEIKNEQKFGRYFINTLKNIFNFNILVIFLINVLIFLILYGVYITYLPLMLKARLHGTSLNIGLVMSLMSVTTAIVSSNIGRLSAKYSGKLLLIQGMIFYSLALALLSISKAWWMVMIPVVIFGMGHGLNIPTIQTMLVSHAPMKERAVFMSINSMVLRIGQTIGPPLMGIAFGYGGFNLTFLAGTGIAVFMILAVLTLKRNPVS